MAEESFGYVEMGMLGEGKEGVEGRERDEGKDSGERQHRNKTKKDRVPLLA